MSSAGDRLVLEGTREVRAFLQQPQRANDAAPRGTEFRPVQEGDDGIASGETLLVEAYAVLWIILFAFLFLSWRRQTRIDARMVELERALGALRGAKGP